MAEAILDLRLDTVQPNRVRLVYGVQNDYNSRYICARFTVNGKPIDIEKTAAVRINAKRPDGNKDAFPGTVNTDGTAKVPVAQWMLDVPGEVSASITAVTTNGALTTQEFYIMAKASLWDSTGEPSAENPDKDVLQTIIASENERVAAESTRVANENARKSAETARATAETKRITDEATRVANEAERVSAEKVRKAEFATWSEEVGKVSAFDKRLENLEAAVSPEIVTPTVDSSVAYAKAVPSGALPNAAITEIGGMSYKCENLIPFPYTDTSKSTNGITWTVNSDGSITVNGTETTGKNAIFILADPLPLPKGDYFISGYEGNTLPSGSMVVLYKNGIYVSDVYTGKKVSVEEGDYLRLYLQVSPNTTINNLTFYPMLNRGETALPYQPYFTGLRDSKVTAVESVGANLFGGDALADKLVAKCKGVKNEVQKTVSFNAWDISNIVLYDKFKENIRYTFFLYGYNESDALFTNMRVDYTDGTTDTLNFYEGACLCFSQPNKTVKAFIGNWNAGRSVLYYEKCGILEGVLPTDKFSPYFKNTFPIPESVQNMDGYGVGGEADYCNKIVLNPAENVKKFYAPMAKITFNGSDDEKWMMLNAGYFVVDLSPLNKHKGNKYYCDKYEPTHRNDMPYDLTVYAFDSYYGASRACFRDSRYTTLEEWKAAISANPIDFIYTVAAPTETDISAYFTDDNFIGVESNGTVTAVNEFEHDVPFTIEYTVKGA